MGPKGFGGYGWESFFLHIVGMGSSYFFGLGAKRHSI